MNDREDDGGLWLAEAREALDAGPGPADATGEIEVLRGHRPPILDASGAGALFAPFLAGIAWTGAVFREMVAETPIDPIALFLRLLALGLTARAILLGVAMARRIGVFARARRYALALAPEGLLVRTPGGERAIARDDVVAIREMGDWRTRKTGRRWADVYVVLRPEGSETHVTLPPVFERTPGELAERLMRWRGPVTAPEGYVPPEPTSLPSKLYDEVAAGARPPGITVIPHGRGWITRGPFATVLLGIAVLDGVLRLPFSTWTVIAPVAPIALAICLVAVPLVWVGLTRREISPRKGLALILTPAEALMRTRSGTLRIPWRTLARVTVEAKPSWSILAGLHDARTLVFDREDAPIRYDEAFLGIPGEVAASLCDAYKRGVASVATDQVQSDTSGHLEPQPR